MANEFVIKNGFFSQGSSNVTGNLTVTQTISGTTAQFTVVSASILSASSFIGTAASLTSVTASALNDTTGSFSISNVQDGQYLKRSGNTIIGSFIMMSALSIANETEVAKSVGTANDTLTGIYAFSGTAVLA
jgi:hypothetical protein